MYGGTKITGYRIHYDTGTKHFTLGVLRLGARARARAKATEWRYMARG